MLFRFGVYLFHYAGFPLGERGVSSQLVVNELHLDFDSALGLLARGRPVTLVGSPARPSGRSVSAALGSDVWLDVVHASLVVAASRLSSPL